MENMSQIIKGHNDNFQQLKTPKYYHPIDKIDVNTL